MQANINYNDLLICQVTIENFLNTQHYFISFSVQHPPPLAEHFSLIENIIQLCFDVSVITVSIEHKKVCDQFPA